MKIQFTIELTQEDLLAALREPDFDSFRVNLNPCQIEQEEKEAAIHQVKESKNSMVLTKVKTCKVCGKEFHPRSNAQVKCSEACGMVPKWKPKPAEPIDKTLEEIQRQRAEREKKPYEFGK